MIKRIDNNISSLGCNSWLSNLLQGIAQIDPCQDRLIGMLQLSSQQVNQGDLFIALPGLTTDGRDYIPQAIENLAAAILYESEGAVEEKFASASIPVIGIPDLKESLGLIASRYFNNPSNNMKVVGVTGTNGKTTTAYLVDQAMELLGLPCGYSGTVGTGRIGELKNSDLTTVDVISMHRQLADFYTQNVKAVTLEVSSHGLDQGRVNGVGFDVAVFTNLSQDHLDYHNTMEEYGLAKRKLFEFSSLSAAVINEDDEFGKNLIEFCKQQRPTLKCLTFGSENADLVADNLQVDDCGITFDIDWQGQTANIKSPLLGSINVPNILSTIGVLIGLKFPLKQIAEIIPELSPPPGRMEVFRNGDDLPAVVVDYAHTPDALERSLQSLSEICRGKLIVVFGCGGDRDQGKRPKMGEIAERLADTVFLTDDNPRFEPAAEIVDQVLQGMSVRPTIIHDRVNATEEAIRSSTSQDIILLAGKGHEQTQTTGTEIVDLCDREFVPELLEKLS